jgi:hypothetical protein
MSTNFFILEQKKIVLKSKPSDPDHTIHSFWLHPVTTAQNLISFLYTCLVNSLSLSLFHVRVLAFTFCFIGKCYWLIWNRKENLLLPKDRTQNLIFNTPFSVSIHMTVLLSLYIWLIYFKSCSSYLYKISD